MPMYYIKEIGGTRSFTVLSSNFFSFGAKTKYVAVTCEANVPETEEFSGFWELNLASLQGEGEVVNYALEPFPSGRCSKVTIRFSIKRKDKPKVPMNDRAEVFSKRFNNIMPIDE